MKRSVATALLIIVMTLCTGAVAFIIAAKPNAAMPFENMTGANGSMAMAGSAKNSDVQAVQATNAATPLPSGALDAMAPTPMAASAASVKPHEADIASPQLAAVPTISPRIALPDMELSEGESVPVVGADTYGTPKELNDNMPKFNYSALAMQTGLDMDVLAKMYSPFYVLDIGRDEMYYPLSAPDGHSGHDKIYGGQVGVDVVATEGEYSFIKAHRYPGGRPTEGYVPTNLLRQVTPDDRYAIIIDKRQQRLFLFERGELKADMYCSTGKTTTETPAGEFLKYGSKHTIYSDADPDVAYYGIKLNGRVYIHSVSHVSGDYTKSINMLGRKSSHGCIRVPLDWAEWFYKNIPDGTKVTITEYRGDTPPLGKGGREGD